MTSNLPDSIILKGKTNLNKNKKEIFIYSLCVLIITNGLWFIGYHLRNINEKSILAILALALACFMPLIITLIMCIISKTKLRTLKIKPNIKKAWKIYLLAIFLGVFIVYSTDLIPLLFFSRNISLNPDSLTVNFFVQIILFTIISIIESIELLGEELGWMGYLYPRLEIEYGIIAGTVSTAVIRTLYHLVALILIGKTINGAILAILSLFINNLFLQSVLVYVTKKADSVFPSAIIHAISNILVVFSFVSYSEGFDETISFKLVSLIPVAITGLIFYALLFKDKNKELN